MSLSAWRFGLPSEEKLKSFQIWDSYFTPAHSHPGADGKSRLIAEIERSLPAVELGQLQRLCYFAHVGTGTVSDPVVDATLRNDPDVVLAPLRRWPQRLMAMVHLNANEIRSSSDAIKRWIIDGPMVGAYFPGGGPGARTCTEPEVERLVSKVIDAGGVIVQHTWFKTGGKQGPGESTPSELAELARRFPGHDFVCAHAGGEWEKGIRAVVGQPNVLIETSGFDPTAGFLEMAVRELGSQRIVFGSHLPSRSLGTELTKVTAANLSDQDKRAILGENFRRLLQSQSN